jgi:hypothetical protein
VDGAQESLPQVFPGRLQPGGSADALLGIGDKVTGPLPGRVQLRDRLVEVHPYPAHPERGAVQGVHRIGQRRVRCRDLASRDGQGGFGRVRAACQAGLPAAADTSAYSASVSANRTVRARRP